VTYFDQWHTLTHDLDYWITGLLNTSSMYSSKYNKRRDIKSTTFTLWHFENFESFENSKTCFIDPFLIELVS